MDYTTACYKAMKTIVDGILEVQRDWEKRGDRKGVVYTKYVTNLRYRFCQWLHKYASVVDFFYPGPGFAEGKRPTLPVNVQNLSWIVKNMNSSTVPDADIVKDVLRREGLPDVNLDNIPDESPPDTLPCACCLTPTRNKCYPCRTPYCSRQCQLDDWIAHRPICYILRRAKGHVQYSRTLVSIRVAKMYKSPTNKIKKFIEAELQVAENYQFHLQRIDERVSERRYSLEWGRPFLSELLVFSAIKRDERAGCKSKIRPQNPNNEPWAVLDE